MHGSPLVSIVLPYRDSCKTLHRCIDSIDKQCFRNWELIAIDDNSHDGSRSIVDTASKNDRRIRSLASSGCGIVDALNSGIQAAKSEIIIRMDSDDVMHPRRIELQFNFLTQKDDIDLVSSRVEYKALNESNFNGEGYSLYVDWSNRIISNEQINLHQFEESPFAHPSVAFRMKLIKQFGGYKKGCFPEDYELWLRWLSKGVKMEKLPQSLLAWYDSPGRLSRASSNYSPDSFRKLKAIYLPLWIKSSNLQNRKISVWGVGKVARKQVNYLFDNGVRVERFYDVDKKKIQSGFKGLPVMPIDIIKKNREELILILSGSRGVRSQITNYLQSKSLVMGIDFISLV